MTICMPCGLRQSLDICRKALFLWGWRSLFAHKTILHQLVFVYNTVVLFGIYKFSIDFYGFFMPFLFALRYTRRRVTTSLSVEIVSPRID